MREIDPAGFGDAPKDPLTVAKFLDSLPSPRISQDRLEYVRSPDRPGVIRLAPSLTPFEKLRQQEQAPPPRPVSQAPPPPPPARRAAVERPVIVMGPAPEPIVETYYVAPIYTGIIVMNPPEKKPKPKRPHKTIEATPAEPHEAETPRVARHDVDDQSIPRSGDNGRRAR